MTRDEMVQAFAEFAKESPVEAFRAYSQFEDIVRKAEYPQLLVGVNKEGDPALLDPEGNVLGYGQLVVVDVAQRWTTPDEADFEKNQIFVEYDSYGDYEMLVYALQGTRHLIPVRLPEGWEEI